MKPYLIFAVLLLAACKGKGPSFAGDYVVTQNGVTTTASLKTNEDALSGLINIGGSAAVVTGKINGNTVTGTLSSTEEKKTYTFTGILNSDTLKMVIQFPELNNQELTFNLKRVGDGSLNTAKVPEPDTETNKAPAKESDNPAVTPEPEPSASTPPPAPKGQQDGRLLGTWKNTEVISSGSGDSYGSFSSESFVQFLEDGTVYTWAGRSAGGGGGQSFESNGSSQKQKGIWRTEGKFIVFTDASSGQEGKTQFMVDAGRMLLSDGGSNKKIYLRVE